MKPSTIIFDMGNVLLPFDPLKPGAVLAEMTGKSPKECVNTIYSANLERNFELGELTGTQFTKGVNRVLGTDMSEQYWRALWSDMFIEDKEVSAIVRALKGEHRLLLLSNTNTWHFDHARESFEIIGEFDDYVLSFEEHSMKPQIAIYEAALRKADDRLPAVFIDDLEANALAGEKIGIRGIWFQNAGQLRNDLQALGCDLETVSDSN